MYSKVPMIGHIDIYTIVGTIIVFVVLIGLAYYAINQRAHERFDTVDTTKQPSSSPNVSNKPSSNPNMSNKPVKTQDTSTKSSKSTTDSSPLSKHPTVKKASNARVVTAAIPHIYPSTTPQRLKFYADTRKVDLAKPKRVNTATLNPVSDVLTEAGYMKLRNYIIDNYEFKPVLSNADEDDTFITTRQVRSKNWLIQDLFEPIETTF